MSDISPERLNADDLPGMLDYEIVARFDAVYAALDAVSVRIELVEGERDAAYEMATRAEARIAALEQAGDNMASVLGPAVDFVQSFRESENAQNLALLMALQLVEWRALAGEREGA